jgi:hypothetical protein
MVRGASVVLGDAAHRTDTKIGKVLNGVVGEDEPLRLAHYGGDLGAKKVDIAIRRGVRRAIIEEETVRLSRVWDFILTRDAADLLLEHLMNTFSISEPAEELCHLPKLSCFPMQVNHEDCHS